jgi:FkbM family methyltransferase
MATNPSLVFLLLIGVQLLLEMCRTSSPTPPPPPPPLVVAGGGDGGGGGDDQHSDDPVAFSSRGEEYPPSAAFPPDLQTFNQFSEFHIPFNISDCKFVFLDLGTNQGRQLRKLYYGVAKRAKWSKLFAMFFSRSVSWRRKHVCAIGAEPDRNHGPVLDELQADMQRRNISAHILRNPVWVNNDVLTFNSIYDPNNTHDASTLSTSGYTVYDHTTKKRTSDVNVTKVQLRGFRLATLLSQLDPDATVLVKLDIEGAEHRVIADLIIGGTICRVNVLGVENHQHLMVEDAHVLSLHPKRLNLYLKEFAGDRCNKTWVRTVDDEM